MHDTNPAQTLVEVVGAIFYALLQLHGDAPNARRPVLSARRLRPAPFATPSRKQFSPAWSAPLTRTRRHPSDRATSWRAAAAFAEIVAW